MSIFSRDKQKQSRRQPDHVGRVDNLGIACWLNRDGNHDVRIGVARQRGQNLFVRTVLPLSMLPEACDTIKTIAETFSRQDEVPRELRETLRTLAERLEMALDGVPPTSQLNGGSSHPLYSAA